MRTALLLWAVVVVGGCASSSARDQAGEAVPRNPALRLELIERAARDQEMRRADFEAMPPERQQAWMHELEAVDLGNTARMKEVVEQYGWPTRALVGADGSQAAWLLVQHADHDVEFQERCLSLLEPAAARGEVSKSGLAYLTDRVLRARGKPQRYGTQYEVVTLPDGSVATDEHGRLRYLAPVVEDPAGLDERRRAVGLGPWAEYDAKMAVTQGRPPFDAPRAAHEPK